MVRNPKINIMKKTTFSFFLNLFLIIFSLNSFSQVRNAEITVKKFGKNLQVFSNQQATPSGHIRCASTENEAYLKAKYPERATTAEFEAWLAPKVAKINADKIAGRANPTVYNIPVVIHIVHNGDALGTGENITDAQVISQITVMNEDYRRLSGTRGGANTTGLAVDTQINFCLAQTDPNGNPTTGIVRHNIAPYSNNVANGSGGADWETRTDVENAKAATIWDPTKYLNMWTFRFGGKPINQGGFQGLLGYAQFPSNSGLGGLAANGGAANTDGVVASFDAMGTIAENDGTFILNPTYNLGRTMTHEVGHWLGLRHIWGDGDCTVDDFCADTPNAGQPNYDCASVKNSCSDPGNDMTQNYMDYTNDACMDTFTNDQKTRILAVMANSPRRNTLNASTACQAPAPIIGYSNLTGSINEGTNCSYTDVTFPITIAKAPSQNAMVTFSVTGGTATQNVDYTIVNPTVTFPTGSTASRNLTVRVFNDGLVETNETITIDLVLNANGGNAVLNSSAKTITLTIVDNDLVPTASQVNTILFENFEEATGWSIFDVDGDTNAWGLLEGLDGYGTTPNLFTGSTAYSEKNLAYLGGTGIANPVNNYLISPQVSLPSSATSVTLSFIAGAFDNTTGAAKLAGNFSVYFTTSIASETAILAGTVIQSNLTFTEATSQKRTYNLMTTPNLLGQTGYIVFRHNNTTANTNVALLVLDDVLIESVTSTLVQTDVNTATLYQATIPTAGTVYAADTATGKVMTALVNTGTFNYGCTAVSVNRSNVSAGATTSTFIDSNAANKILSKTFNITSANDTPTGNYTVKLYFTEAEVAAWETATGKNRSQLNIIKVQNNNVSVVNASNYTSYVIEEKPATITSFGTNVVFEASFTTNMSGGYAVGPKTGIVCGEIATTWNGSSWSKGAPSKVTAVTMNGNYTSTSNLEACSVVINSGSNVVFNAGHTLIVGNEVTVNGTGSLTINNNAALRQINAAATNTGNIVVKRDSAPMIRQDYTAWASPVAAQQLQSFSPNTLPNRFYEYLYTGTTTLTAYQAVNAATNFITGKGYIIRAADDSSASVPAVHSGQFTGVPFNGNLTMTLGKGYNLLGNPYASPIDADRFLLDNTSTVDALYFWTHTVPASGGVYPVNNFAAYTTLGGTASAAGGAIPNGTIQTGQGFYVKALEFGTANFSNLQRVNAATSTQFFRTNATPDVEVEKHRIWLNLNDANNSYNQLLLGYMNGATNDFDNQIDGKVLDDSKPILFNIIAAEKYIIQGRSLPFTDADIVPLGLKVLTAGTYSISMENFDGLFVNQDVFLKDKYNNIIHNIKQTPYVFTAQEGIVTNRFEIVYKNTLASDEFLNESNITVYSSSTGIVISATENIDEIIIFDVLGRKLYHNNKINDKEIIVSKVAATNQALLVQIKLTNKLTTTKKVIF